MAISTLPVILVLTCLVVICGCLQESAYPAYKYTVEIKGLDHYSNNNSTEFYIPIPVMEGGALYNKSSLSLSNEEWSVAPVKTEHGDMLSFKYVSNNLTDINATYSDWILKNRSVSQSMEIVDKYMATPLSPVSTGSPTRYSIYEPRAGSICQPAKNYTSHIFIDRGIEAINNQNDTLEVVICYDIFGGMDSGQSKFYQAEIHEVIPSGIKGWIPVTVWVSTSK